MDITSYFWRHLHATMAKGLVNYELRFCRYTQLYMLVSAAHHSTVSSKCNAHSLVSTRVCSAYLARRNPQQTVGPTQGHVATDAVAAEQWQSSQGQGHTINAHVRRCVLD